MINHMLLVSDLRSDRSIAVPVDRGSAGLALAVRRARRAMSREGIDPGLAVVEVMGWVQMPPPGGGYWRTLAPLTPEQAAAAYTGRLTLADVLPADPVPAAG